MATPITMPIQGQSVEVCVLIEWCKSEGDAVAAGEILFSYETDKASFEFESPVAGTLLATFYNEGDDVPVLSNMAVIGDAGEDTTEFAPAAAPAPAAPECEAAPAPPAIATPAAPVQSATATTAPGANQGVSPRARQAAAAAGVDPRSLSGSGPQGRVIERDVLAAPAASATTTAAPSAMATVAPGPVLEGDCVKDIKLSNIRKIIATRMVESLQQAAQFTLTAGADATAIMACRRVIKERREKLGITDININDLVAYATVQTLLQFPEMNAHFLGDKIRQFENVHLAFAADSPRGLLVPVIPFANSMTLNELALAGKELAGQVRDGTISSDQMTGGTFTISNLGSFGVESFTPVLNLPQVAILGVNTITPRPVQENDDYAIRPHLGLSLTIDHRAVDGAPAAAYLKALCANIANFDLALFL